MFYGILMIVVSVAIMVGASYWANTNQWDDIRKFLCTVVQLMAIGPLIAGVMLVFRHPADKPAAEAAAGAGLSPVNSGKPRPVSAQPAVPRFVPESDASKKAREAVSQKEMEARQQASSPAPDTGLGQASQPDQASSADSAPVAASSTENPAASNATDSGSPPAAAPTSP